MVFNQIFLKNSLTGYSHHHKKYIFAAGIFLEYANAFFIGKSHKNLPSKLLKVLHFHDILKYVSYIGVSGVKFLFFIKAFA